MMNDNDVSLCIRESVSELHMHTPVETILRTAQGQQHKRRAMVTAAAVASVAALAFGVVGVMSADNPPSAARPPTQLAAFAVTRGPGGSTTLTLHKGRQYRLDPDALRRALAKHGIAALVTVNKSCDSSPEPDGLDSVVTTNRQDDGNVFLTINPAAMPTGAQLSVGYFPNHTTFNLIETNAPQHCHA